MARSDKKYILFAGVNGSGKSTLYLLHPEYKAMPRINADELTRKYGTWNDLTAQLKAGREAVTLLNKCLNSDNSFNQETTLCGKSIIRNIETAKENGFTIEVHYIGVDSVDICKERIKKRVADGGHGIPDADVERRYCKSLEKVKNIMGLCNTIYFYDNTEKFTLLATVKNGALDIISENLPDWFTKYVLCINRPQFLQSPSSL